MNYPLTTKTIKANKNFTGLLIAAAVLIGAIAWSQRSSIWSSQGASGEQSRKAGSEVVSPRNRSRAADFTTTEGNALSSALTTGAAEANSKPESIRAVAAGVESPAASPKNDVDEMSHANQAARARAVLDLRYADLFRRLKLPPYALDQLKKLLVERDSIRADVTAVAAKAGLNEKDHSQAIQDLIRQARQEIETGIAQALGPENFELFQNYHQTAAQRHTVKQLEQKLSYTPTPLTIAQMDELANLLWRASSDSASSSAAAGPAANRPRLISDEAIDQAGSVLSPLQVAALKDLKTNLEAMGQNQLLANGMVAPVTLPRGQ